MQGLEVSGAVRLIYRSLGVKWLNGLVQQSVNKHDISDRLEYST